MYKVKKSNLHFAVRRINRLPDRYDEMHGIWTLLTEREVAVLDKMGILEVDLTEFDEYFGYTGEPIK